MANDYSYDQLVERVKTPGWRLTSDRDDVTVEGNLDEVLRSAHDRHTKGEHPGLIQEIETAVELELLQMQQLWRYLGLPV
jgi:hypothetical protein